jgi:hypothetical protein
MNTAAAKKHDPPKRKPAKHHTDAVGAFSISDFCKAHGGISQAFFHKLIGEGRGPKLMKVGARTLISVEAAAAWRLAREAETAT